MKLEIGFLPIRQKIVSIHKITRSHLIAVYESKEFKIFLNSTMLNNAFSVSIKNGLNLIGISFVEYYKKFCFFR